MQIWVGLWMNPRTGVYALHLGTMSASNWPVRTFDRRDCTAFGPDR